MDQATKEEGIWFQVLNSIGFGYGFVTSVQHFGILDDFFVNVFLVGNIKKILETLVLETIILPLKLFLKERVAIFLRFYMALPLLLQKPLLQVQ